MVQQKDVTLLVDGSVLKKHFVKMGKQQTPQLIVQYLTRMTQAIRQQNPNAFVRIWYYGARLTEPVQLPISGNLYYEPELKRGMTHHSVPGAWLHNSWGKVSYPHDQSWILKEESYHKNKLDDSDFVLNEKPKGVLAQLVGRLAERSVFAPEVPMYVYGDADDMAYALHTAQWMGANVKQIAFHDKTPYISEITSAKEPRFCDKNKMRQIGEALKTQSDIAACIKDLRANCPEEIKQSILMIDMGIMRKYLEQRGCRMSVANVQKLLDQIKNSLPQRPTKTVLYCAFANETKLISPFPGEARALVDSAADKQVLSLPNVEFSAGKTVQDKWYPAILKKEKWHVPMEFRGYRDFDYNFHQSDVDDRIIWDTHLYGMDPTVSQLYLVATDGDFAVPVEAVSRLGLPTSLIHLDFGVRDLAFRLEKGADTTIRVRPNAEGLTSRFKEDESKREIQRAKHNKKRKLLQKIKRSFAKADGDEYYSNQRENKADRWAATCCAHRREVHEHLRHRQ